MEIVLEARHENSLIGHIIVFNAMEAFFVAHRGFPQSAMIKSKKKLEHTSAYKLWVY